MVVKITLVQFKQLQTTTPRKKRNEGHIYTLKQMNTTDIQNLYNKNTSMETVPQYN